MDRLTVGGYGMVAITGDAWINERAQEILTHGLPRLPKLPRPPRLLVRRFDPSQARDPRNGKWISIGGGVDVPDLGALFSLDNFVEYDKHYHVFDETSVDIGGDYSLAAISMKDGDTQIAVDTKSHRYVLADADADGMRSFADTCEKMLDSFDKIDQADLDSAGPGELVDHLTWDGTIQVGYDAAGDFRITATDTEQQVPLPELTPEQVQQLIDALIEQADNADKQEE